MRTNKECVALIKTVLDEHNHFWDGVVFHKAG